MRLFFLFLSMSLLPVYAQNFEWCKTATYPSICVGEELSRQMRRDTRYADVPTGVYQYSKGFSKRDKGTRKVIVKRTQGERVIEYYGEDGTLYTKFRCGWEEAVCTSSDRHILTILSNGKLFIKWEDDSHGVFTLLN